MFTQGVFDRGGFVGFADRVSEVGGVSCGSEGEGCAGVGADALGAAHRGVRASLRRFGGVQRLEARDGDWVVTREVMVADDGQVLNAKLNT